MFAVDAAAVVVNGGDVVTAGFAINAVGDFRYLTSAVGGGAGNDGNGGCTGDEAKYTKIETKSNKNENYNECDEKLIFG